MCLFIFVKVVERNSEVRVNARDTKIREYFYGKKGELSPHSCYIDFGSVEIFQIGGKTCLSV